MEAKDEHMYSVELNILPEHCYHIQFWTKEDITYIKGMDNEKEIEMIWQRWLIFEEMKKKIVRYVEDDLNEKGGKESEEEKTTRAI